ncbi:MAG: DMT family transporter [Acidaminococcaceae bacterium]|nr:DMT family transporter [Acidaminococcaceae bacterium]
MLQKYSTTLIIGWGQFLSGGFLCLFINPFEPSGHWDGVAVAAMAYLILGATVLSYSVFLVGLKVVGATKASLISCVEPLASIIAVVL